MLRFLFNVHPLQLLVPYLVASFAQIQLQPARTSDSGVLLNIGRTVLNIFSSCQLVLVKNTYRPGLSDLGEILAQEATGPVLILDTLFYLKPQVDIQFIREGKDLSIQVTYNVRHAKQQTQQRVFLSFPQPDQVSRQLILPEPVFYRKPDGGFGVSKGVDGEEDILVSLLDLRLNWAKNKYRQVRLVDFFCRIPTHTIILEYHSQDPIDMLNTPALYVHLRCTQAQPACMETFAQEASALTVTSIKAAVRKVKATFKIFPYLWDCQQGLPLHSVGANCVTGSDRFGDRNYT